MGRCGAGFTFWGDPGLLRPRWWLHGDGDRDGVPRWLHGEDEASSPRRAVPRRAVPCCAVGWGLGQVLQGLRRSPTRPWFLRPLRLGVAMGSRGGSGSWQPPLPVCGLRGLPEQGSPRAARSPPQQGSSSAPRSPCAQVLLQAAALRPCSPVPWMRAPPGPPAAPGPGEGGSPESRGSCRGTWGQPGAPRRAPGTKLQRGRGRRLAPASGRARGWAGGGPAPPRGTSQTTGAKPRGAESCLRSSPRSYNAGGFKNKCEACVVSGLATALQCPGQALWFAPRQRLK